MPVVATFEKMKLVKREARDLCRENWETKRIRPVVFGTWCASWGRGLLLDTGSALFSLVFFFFFCFCSRMTLNWRADEWESVLCETKRREWERNHHNNYTTNTPNPYSFTLRSSFKPPTNILQLFWHVLGFTDLFKGIYAWGADEPCKSLLRKSENPDWFASLSCALANCAADLSIPNYQNVKQERPKHLFLLGSCVDMCKPYGF